MARKSPPGVYATEDHPTTPGLKVFVATVYDAQQRRTVSLGAFPTLEKAMAAKERYEHGS